MNIISAIFGKKIRDHLDYSSKYMGMDSRLHPHFIENEWYIFPDREEDLERFISFMKSNPRMKVELNFSTSIKDNQLARQLSVNEAIDYFVSEGIEMTKVICSNFRHSSLPCFRVLVNHSN